MKRIILIMTLLLTFLCGCNRLYYEPEQTVIISAIGIDPAENGIFLTLETVDTSSPEGGLEYSKKILTASEKDCEDAFISLQKSLGNKLSAEHCALVIKGEGLNEELLYETLIYLRDVQNLSQNTKIISSVSGGKMLQLKSRTGQAVGYDAVKILNMQENKNDLLKCNLYSVLSVLHSGGPLTLPVFKIEKENYFLKGASNE
jgi:hypothetical protein